VTALSYPPVAICGCRLDRDGVLKYAFGAECWRESGGGGVAGIEISFGAECWRESGGGGVAAMKISFGAECWRESGGEGVVAIEI
jgi:hypothetical protein